MNDPANKKVELREFNATLNPLSYLLPVVVGGTLGVAPLILSMVAGVGSVSVNSVMQTNPTGAHVVETIRTHERNVAQVKAQNQGQSQSQGYSQSQSQVESQSQDYLGNWFSGVALGLNAAGAVGGANGAKDGD